ISSSTSARQSVLPTDSPPRLPIMLELTILWSLAERWLFRVNSPVHREDPRILTLPFHGRGPFSTILRLGISLWKYATSPVPAPPIWPVRLRSLTGLPV